jgi:N5-(carboxyethyl)ornithine synthase
MKRIGFPISTKENERRRALILSDINNILHKEYIYVERGYGDVLGYTDDDYINAGIQVVSKEDVLKCEIICDPKIGDAEYLDTLNHQTIFGWVHAVQNRDITDKLIDNKLTAYAWEDMFHLNRHTFWRNNEIAGEAAVMHAYLLHGIFPYNTKVAVLGRGNSARGAIKTLNYMGADITVYDRKTEELFREELPMYDVVVNAILWDTSRKDHIIYKEDLKRMKRGAMIIDISCDRAGGVETSIPTTIEKPAYTIDGITHYVCDHTPSLFYKTTTKALSNIVSKCCDMLITDTPNTELIEAKIIENGVILDQRINKFQNR